MSSELHELTATEAQAAVAQALLSPSELVAALHRRIDEVDPKVQAWETVDRPGALQAAQVSERLLRQYGPRPLEGVPVGIKDIFYTEGIRTSASFGPLADFVPSYDAEAVARLKQAGAILLGKTVTTQFAFSDPPRTRNPYRLDRTPGGSSSGSGAAVSARMVPVALGTQTAGSVLRPAGYCGVIGFKPTFGAISRYGIFPLSWSFDHVGIIARTVEDIARVFAVMAGPDAKDPASLDHAWHGVLDVALARHGAPHIALVTDFLDRAEPEVRANTEAVAAHLARAGAQVEEVRLPLGMDTVLSVHQIPMQSEAAAVHARNLAEHPDAYGPVLRRYVEVGQLLPAAAYVHAQRLRRRIKAETVQLLSGFDGFLTPTASNTAPDPATTGDRSFQAVWTMMGLPSIALPTGLSPQGLPFSVQLAAAPFGDAALLSLARWCETLLDPMPPPHIE